MKGQRAVNDDGREDVLTFGSDTGSIQATYRHISFEVKSLYSPRGVWTAYITSDAMTTDIFAQGQPPTFTTRTQALIVMLEIAITSLDALADRYEPLLNQLGAGHPISLPTDDPLSLLVRDIAEGLLSRDDLDQSSEAMQRFRRAYEQSQ